MALAEVRDDRTPEEIEEERRQRIADLAAPSRLGPIGDVRPTDPVKPGKTDDTPAPRLERADTQELTAGDIAPPGKAPARPVTGELSDGDLAPTARLKPLSFADRQRLPVISPGAEAGSSGQYRSEIARAEDAKANPWGTPENHPGRLGKIGHALGTIGNIAGEIFAPATMQNISGTRLGNEQREQRSEGNLDDAQKRETAVQTEKNRAAHEENVEGTNEEKIRQAQEKIDETAKKDLSTREVGLRKQGLKLDADGKAVPLQYDDMSPTEQAVHDLKVSQADSADAKALLDKFRANPNTPQAKAALERVQIMAKNAATAAGKLGLDQKKFTADYFGLDEHGQPLPGVAKDESGAAIGPRVQNASKGALAELNKNYVKPANDVEKSYQMANNAYNDFKAAAAKGEHLDTGAESMVMLSTHLATTFGNVKGARITKDMIEHHLGARGISDAAEAAINKLRDGDVLSTAQWEAFHKLISQSRGLSWATAAKEAKRANQPIDFLPEDLQRGGGEARGGTGESRGGGAAASSWKAPEGAPAAPKEDGHKLKVNGTIVGISRGGQWQRP